MVTHRRSSLKAVVAPQPVPEPAPAAPAASGATERIVESITTAIIERRLMPGTKLAEQQIADIFGVSRTLVRQALNQLSRDRLVTLEPARGARIAAYRQRLGLVFQDYRLLADRSIADNVALPLKITGCDDTELQKRVRAALDLVALGVGDLGVGTLDHGVHQIQAVAGQLGRRLPPALAPPPPPGVPVCVIVERGATYDDITAVVARDPRILAACSGAGKLGYFFAAFAKSSFGSYPGKFRKSRCICVCNLVSGVAGLCTASPLSIDAFYHAKRRHLGRHR